MELGLRDKAFVVLASTDGVGNAVARSLLGEGARVALSGRDPERLAAALAPLSEEHGERAFGEPLDVTDAGALTRHLEGARARWGTVHGLVTNAGGPPPGTATQVTDEGLDAAFELTFRSAFHAIQTALPWMRAQGFGRIVALTSMSVRHPIPTLAYSNVMRSGLTAWLKTLAGEVAADGVLVNSVCTGMFATERLAELFESRAASSGRTADEERVAAASSVPVRRIGRTEELGDVVAFLCSERASYVNGVALAVDGGHSTFLL